MILLEELEFMQFLKDEGYTDMRPIGDGRYAAIQRLMFTHSIVIGELGDRYGINDRWCYHDHASAARALAQWDGVGEPQGWHRHPTSGRRRPDNDPSAEYINP